MKVLGRSISLFSEKKEKKNFIEKTMSDGQMHFVTNNTKPECEMGWTLDIFAPFNKKFSTIRYPTAAIDENIFFKTSEDKISIYFKGKKINFC